MDGYDVEELAPGVKSYHRKDIERTTYEESAPWVHFHYGKTDAEGLRDGETEIELCCHGCGVALWVTMPFPCSKALSDRAKMLRAEFNANHLTHNAIYVEDEVCTSIVGNIGAALKEHPLCFLCPSFRKQIFHVDLRTFIPSESATS